MTNEEIKNKYNSEIQDKYHGSYEYGRWFSSPINESGFYMNRTTIHRVVWPLLVDAKTVLELGPGPGTGTKELMAIAPEATYDLVDISEKMIEQSKQSLDNKSSIRFFCMDFLDYRPDCKYDLFFSSRAVEYFSDKRKFVQKVGEVLAKGGKAVIITKMPRYYFYHLVGRPIPQMHRLQIKPKALEQLFRENGFIINKLTPASSTIPLLKSAKLNSLAFTI
ncbi:MAG: class I SAM-dependent methyltransferase, partial [Patescibacteria group bacterium]